MSGGLGRRVPTDFEHVAKFPLSALIADTTHELVIPPANVEKSLGLPWWWKQADQGNEGSCVGWGCSHMMSVTNHLQRRLTTGQDLTYRYAAPWLYDQAQAIDEWPETPPEEGTSVRAGCEVLRVTGHRRVQRGVAGPADPAHGISAYRWATSIDEVRAAIYANLAVAIGVTWYDAADRPQVVNGERWILRGTNWGYVRGGHCVALYRMSDSRQAFSLMNSWGGAYAPVWLPYAALERLIDEYGEVVAITDR